MAYALRYYKEIAQADGSVIRLEIHKKDSTAEAIEIGAVIQGLSLNIQGQQDEIDTPIQKTSLSMTFVDANDIDNGQKNGFWEEFYTPDALLWKVILKAKNASQTSFSTIWGGYVTPDSFSEDLVYRGSVNIIARDNIGHMQDFTFDALGDADGMISLRNLVDAGWEKIASPMELIWDGGDWLSCGDVVAFNTLMNVSMFEGMNWYKAIETALASYGAVMRYVGGNEVIITTLRHLPSFGANVDTLPHVEPVFVSGAQRELVPAVRKIEESVEYELVESWSAPQVKESDFSGNVGSYRCEIEGENFGTVEHDAPVWDVPTDLGNGWGNDPTASLFFNVDAYELGYFSEYRGLGEEMKRYMYLAANNVDDRSVWYSKAISCADMAIRIKFGDPISLDSLYRIEHQISFALKAIRYIISLQIDGGVRYYAGNGIWQSSEVELEKTFDVTANETEFIETVGMDDNVGPAILTIEILNIEYAQTGYGSTARYGLYACIQDLAFTTSDTSSLREKNTVNTIYNADNNVILSRSPEIGPAFDKVALPGFIKNGIFVRSEDDEILPARLWSWGGSEQQMAVWNHLQLLCYYAKPNNLISGTIVNADLSRVANIWVWHGAEHILVSGTYNFLNGRIESAVLREFARYDDMWSEVADASLPETEEDSTSNVESGSPAGGSSSTYTATQTVNIGTGGGVGASYLNDLLDVNVDSVSAQSVLYYNGTEWVSLSKAALLSGFVKEDDLEAILSAMNADIAKRALQTDFYTLALAVEDNTTNIKNAKGEIDTLKTDKADKATTLAGYGITDAYTKDDLATYKAWWDDMMSLVVKEGSNIKIKTNLIVEGDTASTKAGTDAGTSGTLIGVVVNGTSYDDETNGMLDLSTLMNQYALATAIPSLDGYAKLTDIPTIPSSLKNPYALTFGDKTYDGSSEQTITASDLGALTSHQSIYGLTVKNSAGTQVFHYNPAASVNTLTLTKAMVGLDNVDNKSSATIRGELTSANVTNALGYTPLSTAGGTITSSSVPLYVDRTLSGHGYVIIGYLKNGAAVGYLGFDQDGNGIISPSRASQSDYYALIHSGNISYYALPLSGGTITGTTTDPIIVNTSASSVGVSLQINKVQKAYVGYGSNVGAYLCNYDTGAYIGVDSSGSPFYHNGTIKNTLIHSGNIGSYAPIYDSSKAVTLAGHLHLGGYIYKGGYTVVDFSGNSPLFGYGTAGAGLPTWVCGNEINFTYGTSRATAMYINSSGNVLIGTTTDSGYKLDVNGTARVTGAVTMSSTLNVKTIKISSTEALAHLAFGRAGFNYVSIPKGGTLAFAYDNLSQAGSTMYMSEGVVTINGNAIITGDTATGSDIRFKDKLSDHRIALSDIANAPLFTFKWNDREDDSVHLGSSAQYWEKVAPWLVKGEDFKTLDYSTLGVAIGISLANKTINLEDRIKILEKENKALKEELRRIQYGS